MDIGHLTIVYNKETKECSYSMSSLSLLELLEVTRQLVDKTVTAVVNSAQLVSAMPVEVAVPVKED